MEVFLLELENTPKVARNNAEKQQKIQKQIDYTSELKLNHVSFYLELL